jgi:hypothetical protein
MIDFLSINIRAEKLHLASLPSTTRQSNNCLILKCNENWWMGTVQIKEILVI